MPRKIQTRYTAFPTPIVCLGDSFTYNYTLGVIPDQFYAYQVQELLNAAGANVRALNLGRSGDSTPMILARTASATALGLPALAVLLAGTNDTNAGHYGTVQASPTPTTTRCGVSTGVGATLPVGSWVLINGQSAQITTQVGDVLEFTAVVLPVSGQTIVPDTTKNLQAIQTALRGAGIAQIILCTHPYINFSTGGDYPTESPALTTLRAAQRAAVVAPTVLCDLYGFMAARIGVQDVGGSASWHVYDLNTHFNAYGENLFAQNISALVQAQAGWMAALT